MSARPEPAVGRVIVVVAAGGVLGALARYGIEEAFPRVPGQFPWPVLLINVLGGLGIGVLMGWLAGTLLPSPLLRPFLGIGVLGGFTTLSTSSLDGYQLLDADRPFAAAGYLALTVAAALVATAAGESIMLSARPAVTRPGPSAGGFDELDEADGPGDAGRTGLER